MAARWFYTKGDDQLGPVAGVVLKRLVNAGKLLPTDLVMKEGTDQWWPAGSIKGLFPTQPTPQALSSPNEVEEGRLELSWLERYFCTKPWGFVTVLLAGFATLLICVLISLEDPRNERADDPYFMMKIWVVMDFLWLLVVAVFWLICRAEVGKKTTCPRCGIRFSKLLTDSKATVLDSQEETRQYTALKAIRDDRLRIVGFVDEERTRTVISRIVKLDRKYRCKSCGHRWETSDIETLLT